ncbi:beta-lactamase [Mycobacteroides abscessus subsp. massiliense]|nr:beta-lactamase [Mycobacteroides abscessus subsp. massiliense]
MLFPIGSVGHSGFTGVTVWIDAASDTYVVVLANVIHQRGGPPIVGLSGDIATTAEATSLTTVTLLTSCDARFVGDQRPSSLFTIGDAT